MGLWLRQWRVRDPRVLWLVAIDVIGTLWLISFLLTGQHHLVVRLWAVLGWLLVVPGISVPAVVRVRHREHS